MGGLFGPPAENFGMTSITFFFYPPAHCVIKADRFFDFVGGKFSVKNRDR